MRYLVNIQDYSLDDYCYIYEKPDTLKYYADMTYEHHIPVLLNETLDLLQPKAGEVYVDCTFGAGGHTRAILEKAKCKVIAIDRDTNVKMLAEKYEQEFGDRFIFVNDRFSNLDEILDQLNIEKVDGIIMDLGFSSMQVDTPRRGFSFQSDGPLDMRMGSDGVTAADFVNNATDEEIADVLFKYGDEKKSRQIARAIVRERDKEKITTTARLAEIIAISAGKYNDDINAATRSFQAIRIFINEEFEELKSVLQIAKDRLKQNGRLVVITFHSGEDSIVKDFFKKYSGHESRSFSRYSPSSILPADTILNDFELLNSKAIPASDDEIKKNVRARSAKVRGVKKLK